MKGLCIGGPLDGKQSPEVLYGRSFNAPNRLSLDNIPISAVLPDASVVSHNTTYLLVRFYSVHWGGEQSVRFYWVPDEHCPDEQAGRDYVMEQMTKRYTETFEQVMVRFHE